MQKWLAEKNGKSCPLINGNVQNNNQSKLEVLYEIESIFKITPKNLINLNIK
jgi:hypothetical protein